MHSTIERVLSRCRNVFHPSQLSILIQMARKVPGPYSGKEVVLTDIKDWKAYSVQLRILRVRVSDEGDDVDWTKIMQIKVEKPNLDKIFFKTSHLKDFFSTLSIGNIRRSSAETGSVQIPPKLSDASVQNPPKLSDNKYADLQSLCRGTTPVIRNPDHIAFYRQLPH